MCSLLCSFIKCSSVRSEFPLFEKTGPSEEVIYFYLLVHPLKLLTFAPSVPGPGYPEWPRGTTKDTKCTLSTAQNGCFDVICSKLALDTSKSFVYYLLLVRVTL